MMISYRPANLSDIDGIVAVFLGCWLITYAAVLPRSLVDAMTADRADTLWTRVLGEEAVDEVIVAVSDEPADAGIVGVTRWCATQHGDDRAEGVVHSLYVSPAAQGRGVGSALLIAATDRLTAAGVATARLWVFRDNSPSIAFYRRAGWLPDGTTRVQEEFGQPEISLAKALNR